ncbi:MAG: hypothetical protein MJ072_05270, partial [Clostridia bacterium]|nr:hypothetical protein [Clostridia bacterium]
CADYYAFESEYIAKGEEMYLLTGNNYGLVPLKVDDFGTPVFVDKPLAPKFDIGRALAGGR